MASHEYQQQLNELANKLVSPERYGNPAVQASVLLHLPLPEIARVYNFPIPVQPGETVA